MNKYKITLRSDKENNIAFAQGENGEVLYISAFPGAESINMDKYTQLRDAILNSNHHLNHYKEYITLKEVDQTEAMMMFGLPEITPLTAAQHDLRKGIQVVSEKAMREIKG